jgi:hypothetical protein
MAFRSPLEAALIAVLVCLVIAGVATLAWYHAGSGWTAFTFNEGDYASWTPESGAYVGGLRFRNTTFTISAASGGSDAGLPVSADVTGVLNRMARGFEGLDSDSSPPAPPVLALSGPLNAFSFSIPGVTDPASGAAFASSHGGGTSPTCKAESDCTANAFPTGWTLVPIPAPTPPTDSAVVVPGQSTPANFMCVFAATNEDSGANCQTPPPATKTPPAPSTASSGCGISYATPGTCFRAAVNPTAKLSGEYRSFKPL